MADQNTHDLKNQQLLSAYVDGELGVADRAMAERLIRGNPRYAQLVEQWRESGIDLRALPKQRLDDGFADRVLDGIDQLADKDDVSGGPFQSGLENSSPALAAGNSSNQSNNRLALLAIGALCASILLTLFAFPALVNRSPSAATAVAANGAGQKPEPEPESKSELNTKSDPLQDVVAQQQSPVSYGPIVRAPRSMKLVGSKLPSGAITAIEVAQSTEGVEQILHVKLEPADREFNIERVFSKHLIKTFGIEEPSSPAGQSGVEAIYAAASLDQIRAASEQLVEEHSAKVTIVSVPPTPIEDNSATRLKSRSFDSRSSDSELARLDQWFGLSAPSDESRSIRFLILLTR